jgi:hypothetical protein
MFGVCPEKGVEKLVNLRRESDGSREILICVIFEAFNECRRVVGAQGATRLESRVERKMKEM